MFNSGFAIAYGLTAIMSVSPPRSITLCQIIKIIGEITLGPRLVQNTMGSNKTSNYRVEVKTKCEPWIKVNNL